MSTTLTVLLATCDRPQSLRETLESLCRVEHAGIDWRVLVVNNGTDTRSQSMIEDFAANSDLPLELLNEPNPGKSRALNRGLEAITEGLVLFIDDDVRFSQGWLTAYAAAEAHWPEVGIFGGKIIPLFPEHAPQWVQQDCYVHQGAMFSYYAPLSAEGLTSAWPIGPNMAIRRRVIGTRRFDPRFGPGGDYGVMSDETEFVERLLAEADEQIVYVPDAAVRHFVRDEQLSREAVWARAYKWGRSLALAHGDSDRSLGLLGAPLRCWLAAARAFVRFAPFCLGPRHFYLKYGWQWRVRAGRVRGYRELRKRRSADG